MLDIMETYQMVIATAYISNLVRGRKFISVLTSWPLNIASQTVEYILPQLYGREKLVT